MSRWVFYMVFWICVAFTTFQVFRAYVISNSCKIDVSDIPTAGGFPRAEVVETYCDGFGGSDVVEIFIRTSGDNNSDAKKLVFKYDPSSFSGPLQLSWVGPNELAISVDRVDGIEVRETQVFGYTVSYHIGAIGPKIARR